MNIGYYGERLSLFTFFTLFLILLFGFNCANTSNLTKKNEMGEVLYPSNPNPKISTGKLSLVTWNIQNLGDCKMSGTGCKTQEKTNRSLLIAKEIKRLLEKHDIILIQEVSTTASIDDDELEQFVKRISVKFKWLVSKDLGTTLGNRERYLVLFDHHKLTLDHIEYIEGCMIRSAMTLKFKQSPIQFVVAHITAKKESILPEMQCIENGVKKGTHWIVAGDTNADCTYHPRSLPDISKLVFVGEQWYVQTGIDTTVSPTTFCTYDRIISSKSVKGTNVKVIHPISLQSDLQEKYVSDHYPVSIEILLESDAFHQSIKSDQP